MKWLSVNFTVCFFTFFLSTGITNAQQFKWAKGGGSTEDLGSLPEHEFESAHYLCTDAVGNVYMLGQVGGTGPITADTFYKASGAYGADQNIFITSYTCSGQMRWAKLISSLNSTEPFAITADNSGHIYVAGLYTHLAFPHILYIGYDTTISSSTATYLSSGLIQLDTTGHFNWIRFVGQNTATSLSGTGSGPLAIDPSNNVHYFCYMESGIAIAPGDTSQYGVYDLTYNPSGTMLSAVRLDLDSEWYLNGALIDPATNKLYVSGQINQFIYGGTLTDSFYAAAFDASRHQLWQYFAGHGDDDAISGITMDQNKGLYFSGSANFSAFGGGPLLAYSFNGDSVTAPGVVYMSIIMKTDTNGSVRWIQHFDSHLSNAFLSITSLPNNKVAAFGGYEGIVSAGPVSIPTALGIDDAFLVIVDSSGDLQAMQQIPGDGDDAGYAITADREGSIYVAGYVGDSIWGGSPPIPAYHSVGGNTDFFVMKYGVDCSCTGGPISSFSDTGSHTIGVTYTGTTTGLDSVVWNFADGSSATGITTTHTYTLAGTYHVCATVYTNCGNDIYCTNITVVCVSAPIASFTKTGTHVLSVTYAGTTSGVDSVGWIFGDGFRDTGTTVTHTYTATGTYDVCAVAHSQCGNDTACHYDTVVCVSPPVAGFTETGSPTTDVNYTGTTTGVDSIGWIFGDGFRSSGTTASHTYALPGIYNVCVVAHCSCGNDTLCHNDTVVCVSAPVAAFTDTGIITIGTNYTGTTVAIDSIVWDFGDGSSTVTGTTAIHTYSAIGTYHICVTAYTPCGSNTACKNDTVLCVTAPVASFTDTGTHTVGFDYTGTTADIDSVVWSFGDGHTASGLSPIHTYTASGTYHVCVTSYTGCGVDSVCRDITILVASGVAPSGSPRGGVTVFPNPAGDELTIEAPSGSPQGGAVLINNMMGQEVYSGVMSGNKLVVNISGLASGVYILELVGLDGERDVVRVVKE